MRAKKDGAALGVPFHLEPEPPDPLLALIELYRHDSRPEKIDLGVGVYRDQTGNTPIFRAVTEAEKTILAEGTTKTYRGAPGNVGFLEAVVSLTFGRTLAERFPIAKVQTPGGTGALRLAAEMIAKGAPDATIWLGTPAYPNHAPIFSAAGLKMRAFPYYDTTTHTILFAELLAALADAKPGDAILLHGACHNPTGADLSLAQWRELSELVVERGLLPLIDVAYQGLGDGLDEDMAGPRAMIEQTGLTLVTYSCSKNFGLYRERTGALFAVSRDAKLAEAILSNFFSLARVSWSLPPDHGAEIVRVILSSSELTGSWHHELASMRERIAGLRMALARAAPRLSYMEAQRGLFSMLSLGPEEIDHLRRDHGIYMAGSGRINIAGLTSEAIPRFLAALQS